MRAGALWQGNTLRQGYVTNITEKCAFDPQKIKEIHSPVMDGVGVEDCQIRLARWIRRSYGGTMIQALKTVLPARQTVKKVEHKKVRLAVSREEESPCWENASARSRLPG